MSCLFNSFAKYFAKIGKPEFTSFSIRTLICDYLNKDPILLSGKKFSEIILTNKEDYITQMRRTSTWGSAIEIRAACNIFRIIIIVKVISSGREIEFLPSKCNENCCVYSRLIITWSGSHYEYFDHIE
jgi:hypothetical protein